MFQDYGFEREGEEEYVLSRIKRDWCPEWLWAFFAPIMWIWPLKYIFSRKVK